MNGLTLENPKEVMVQQLATLRGYASRVILRDESLPDEETAAQESAMQLFLAAGESYGLTPKEIVGQVLGDLSLKTRDCGCHSCRSRG